MSTRLPYQAEIAIVITIVFGLSIVGSVYSIFEPTMTPPISELSLRGLLVTELLLGAMAFGFLHLQGWRFASLELNLTLRTTGEGVLLALAALAINACSELIAHSVFGVDVEGLSSALVQPGLSIATIVAVSIVNPVYEEVFVAGYLISTLREKASIQTAINLSVAIRLANHLYQGALAAVSIIPIGLIFAYWYARRRSLWPLIVAHGLLDFVGLISAAQ